MAIAPGCAHVPSTPSIPVEASVGRLFLEGWDSRNFDKVLKDAKDGRIGGVVIFSSSSSDLNDLASKIAMLRKSARYPLIFAIDGEGGRVLRLPNVSFASAAEMGRHDGNWTKQEGRAIALALRKLGINLNLAPVVDLAKNSRGPLAMSERCFSSEPSIVSAHALAFISSHDEIGIQTTLKHFPGHGSSGTDSHLGATDISATWSESELQPYRDAISAGFKGAVLVGHLLNRRIDPTYPASLSRITIQKWLRDKLRFQGPVISDDLQMGALMSQYSLQEAVKLAISAGDDLLIIAQRFRDDDLSDLENWVVDRVRDGEISRDDLQAALAKIDLLLQPQ